MNIFSSVRLSALALTLSLGLAAQAQTSAPPSPRSIPGSVVAAATPVVDAYVAAAARWKNDLAAFANADKQQLPKDGGVLFVGSSTIRMWNSMADDFRDLPVVINRGFGGSTMNDCNLFAKDLVVRYKPRQVLVYAGDNDLAEGRTPMQVLESFAHFASTVRGELPDVRISYISVKPSPSREKLLPQIRATNDMIAAYVRRLPNSEYIDIFTPMIDADGRPRAELFRTDQLHLNAQGYALWKNVIASRLPPAAGSQLAGSATQGAAPVSPADKAPANLQAAAR
ncbi:Lysophospholipase L1 [Burkholderiales bacterium 8X]|nr:Lysophospholipase L1 [Burkholderiales bacterium 8X]